MSRKEKAICTIVFSPWGFNKAAHDLKYEKRQIKITNNQIHLPAIPHLFFFATKSY